MFNIHNIYSEPEMLFVMMEACILRMKLLTMSNPHKTTHQMVINLTAHFACEDKMKLLILQNFLKYFRSFNISYIETQKF